MYIGLHVSYKGCFHNNFPTRVCIFALPCSICRKAAFALLFGHGGDEQEHKPHSLTEANLASTAVVIAGGFGGDEAPWPFRTS